MIRKGQAYGSAAGVGLLHHFILGVNTAITTTPTNIGGIGIIIGTITTEIMIGITTGIDASRDSLGVLLSFSNGWK
jgi:hypothetical protein